MESPISNTGFGNALNGRNFRRRCISRPQAAILPDFSGGGVLQVDVKYGHVVNSLADDHNMTYPTEYVKRWFASGYHIIVSLNLRAVWHTDRVVAVWMDTQKSD